MSDAFTNSGFNQNLSSWNTSGVVNMVRMFAITSYNYDLSGWDVSNVTNCENFAASNTSWSLPKPAFTNCDPN